MHVQLAREVLGKTLTEAESPNIIAAGLERSVNYATSLSPGSLFSYLHEKALEINFHKFRFCNIRHWIHIANH